MRRRRLAWWSPLPPTKSGIADYSYTLLSELRSRFEIEVIVPEDAVARSVAPPGVGVVPASERQTIGAALDVYHMGNNPLHEYMHRSILESPGLLVLHDPALVDFYWVVCGSSFGTNEGGANSVFWEEVAFNLSGTWPPARNEPEELEQALHMAGSDRLELLLSKRVVDASLATVVHSRWAVSTLASRSPQAELHQIPQFAEVQATVAPPSEGQNGRCVVATLGDIAARRLRSVIAAVAQSRREGADVSLLVVGWSDGRSAVEELRRSIADEQIEPHVTVELNVSLDRLRQVVDQSDIVVALRWPTAGETSSVVSRALTAGRPVIVSDVPQYRELSPEFAWLVPVEDRAVTELSRVLTFLAASPELRAKACRAAARYGANELSLPVVANRYTEVIERCIERHGQPSKFPRMDGGSPPTVNAIASWTATTGLAEAARRTVVAMLDAGLDVALDDIDYGAPRRPNRFPSRFAPLPAGRPYDIDICFLNVNEIATVTDDRLRGPGRPRRLIGAWHWEQPTLPNFVATQLSRVDEIWVASQFVAESLGAFTWAPVIIIPLPVEPDPDPGLSRSSFGLPAQACLFFFSFDAHSTLARKNPWDVIRAYRRAFGPIERQEDVRLIMKTINLATVPEARQRLRAELTAVNGILIEDDLSARETASLFACADVYVSLHRSEGFGLGIAESMALGKPVIATGYSGNMDFMTATNSWPVPYSIVTANEAELRFNPGAESVYVPGSQWAAPNVVHASQAMRLLYERPALRRQLGLAASHTMRERYTSAAAGRRIKQRLREVTTGSQNGPVPQGQPIAAERLATR